MIYLLDFAQWQRRGLAFLNFAMQSNGGIDRVVRGFNSDIL